MRGEKTTNISHHSSHEDKKFKCEICGTFATNAEDRLKVHMNIHTGDRPFKCDYCPKDFSHRSALSVMNSAYRLIVPFWLPFCY